MTRLILFLLVSAFASADPNSGPNAVQFWGTPTGFMIIEEHEPRVIAYRSVDPNKAPHIVVWSTDNAKTYLLDSPSALKYLVLRWLNPLSMESVNVLSRHWQPAPRPIEPNIPPVIEMIEPAEPNLPDTSFGLICYTLGGKQHLYQDCRYIAGKDWTPCACDPNNLCLTCVKREIDK